MTDPLTLVLKAKALREGRAVRLNSAGKWKITAHPLILVTSLLSGEDATLLGFMCGEEGERPEFSCVLDPRNRDEQYGLFLELGSRLRQYFADCRERGTQPQIIVPNQATVRHLEVLAHRTLGLRVDEEFKAKNPSLQARNLEIRSIVGGPLGYVQQRAQIAGQQIVVPAAAMLTSLWVTGQSALEDLQLSTVLAWVLGTDTEAAEFNPSVPRLRPEFDRDVYEPVLRRSLRAGANKAELQQEIAKKLQEQMDSAFNETCLALTLAIERARSAPHLDALATFERDEFEYFMDTILDKTIPSRSVGAFSARAFEINEALEGAVESLFARYDPITRLRMKIVGDLIQGTLETHQQRNREVVLKVNLDPNSGFPRRNDEIVDQFAHAFKVIETRDQDRVVILITKSKQGFTDGMHLEMIKHSEDLKFVKTLREFQAELHKRKSWLRDGMRKDGAEGPIDARRSVPPDLMSRLENLR